MQDAAVTGTDGWAAVYEANADRLVQLATFLAGPHAAVGGFRSVNWLDPSGTWVTLTADGAFDLDHVITSTHPVSVDEWRKATGLSA